MKPSPSGTLTRASLLACASLCAISTVHAASGTWTGTTSFGLWSAPANWSGGTVADGAGSTANFSTLDLPEGLFVASLDSPRTIGSLIFGDTDIAEGSAGSWQIDNNLDPLNVLTLAGSPTITVNALGDIFGFPATAEITAGIAGSDPIVKAGAGTLVLSGTNTYSGGTTVNAGTFAIGGPSAIGTGPLTLAGGDLGCPFGATLTTNNAQNWNADFTFAGPSNLVMGTGAVAVPANRTVTVSSAILDVAGVITGSGTFTKDGAGELRLHGDNLATLTGPLVLKNGTLKIRGNLANNATGAALNQNPLGDTTRTITFEGGTLAVNGNTGSNGPTTGVLANPLFIDAGQTGTILVHQRGQTTSTLTGSGTLNWRIPYVRGELNNANWSAFTGAINLINAGGGDFRIVAGNAYFTNARLNVGTGVTVYQQFNPPNNGALTTVQPIGELSGDGSLGGNPVNGRFVEWSVGALNSSSTFNGSIVNGTGAARLAKVGTGTLTLTGTNTFTGTTTLTAGKLHVGDGGATGSLGNTNVTAAAGTELAFNRDDSAVSAYPGVLAGAGAVIKRGSGQVNFTGANTYTSGTLIEGGILGINSASSLGTAGAVNFTTGNGGVVAIAPGVVESRTFSIGSGVTASLGGATAADSLEISSAISGSGSLAVSGAGVLRLSGANSYGGATTVAGGALVAANASGSATSTGAVSVTGGTLAGTGTIGGAVTVAAGSSLKPGALTPTSSGTGNLTVGSLALAGGATIHTEFTDAVTHDKLIVTGVNGLTSTASLANPVMVDLRVVNSSAKWTTPGTYTIAEFAGGFVGNANDLFEVTPASQQIGQTYTFAVVGNSLRLTIAGNLPSIWNVNASGNWSVAGNWQNGSPNAAGATAQFTGAITGPQTVTLDAARTVGVLAFSNANAYTIGGGATLTLDQTSGNAEIDVLAGSHAITAPIQLADTLDIDLFAPANSLSLLGNITGSGGIVKSGPGDLTLGGTNSFSGNLSFAHGALTFSSGSLGAGNLTLNGASLVWAPGNSQDITAGRTILFGGDPVTFAMDDNVTLAQDFGSGGLANLTKDGFGTLTLTADNSFPGNVTVANGGLTLGNGGLSGSIPGNIHLADPGTILTTHLSGDHGIGNLISGSGSLVLNGAGLHTLTQANTFTGTTTIHAGTAVVSNPFALQGSTLVYDKNGGKVDFEFNSLVTFGALEGDKNLALENSDLTPGPVTLTVGGNGASTTYTGILSGPGSLTKTGAGIMSMTGAHTYTGATLVNGGVLDLGPAVTLNNTTVSVGPTGRLTSAGATITASALSHVANGTAGGAVFEMYGGTASFSAGLNGLGNSINQYLIHVSGGSLSASSISLGRSGLIITAEPAAGSVNDGLFVSGGDVDIAGSLLLGDVSGANSSVSARIDDGSLDVAGPVSIGLNNGGRWSVIDVGGGTFTSTDTGTGVRLGGPLQGNAAFLTRGGVATVERFQFGNAALGGTGTVHVSGGELYVGFGGMVVGTTQSGYVATLRLSGGILGAKADWSAAIPVATSNVFSVKAADAANVARNITLSGAVTGTGSLFKEGAGTLTLSGAYSYSGNTDVTAGTLSLGTGTLSDTGIVDVSTGATLHLNFTGTDTVAGFSIDGAPQAAGTWGSLASTATHKTARITGNGILVVPVADPFQSWITGFPVGALDGKGDDADGDGLTNIEEFGLDADPSSGAASGKVRSRIETVGGEQALVITLPVRDGASFGGTTSKTATIDDVVYTIEGSNTLALFDQGVTEIAASAAGLPDLTPGWTYRTFRLAGAIGGATPLGPKGFLRATVADAP